uniref:Transposon Ty3-I Gag-Pol polyprotein n=1 Tax=Cajanus cajan TaxID=3821 RepID=A0A151S2F0_CAJCA|nr:Transposon Ty3-I Gag-Pol polyprotein [Cajanus cajan]
MKFDIQSYVQQCVICQQAKHLNTKPAGLLQPLPIPSQIWEDIAMDFITGLPIVKGYSVILVVVDRLSKYGHFQPLKPDFTSLQVAEAFISSIVRLHGIPKTIVSDRDRVFMSRFWQQLFTLQGTTLAMSSAYHPQSDGQTEALNKCLEMYLSLGMTPFQAVYGRLPPAIIRYAPSQYDIQAVQDVLHSRDILLAKLKDNLIQAQQHMKLQADRHRQDIVFAEGDKVWVRLQPYRQHSVALRQNQKLSMKYFGPFTITQRIGNVAYKLALPATAKIHPVFHVSQLKAFRGNEVITQIPTPLLIDEKGLALQPKAILQHRTILKKHKQIPQVLVHWEGQQPEEASWEDRNTIEQSYPLFNLKDKVVFNGGGNVTSPHWPREGNESQGPHGSTENGMNEQMIGNQMKTNSVMQEGHVEQFPWIMHPRKSDRMKRENVRLRGYVMGQ